MRSLFFRSLLLSAVVLGSGCTTIDYIVPESEPHARLRLYTDVMGGTSFYAFDEEDCKTGVKLVGIISPISILTIEKLGMPGFPEGERGVREVRISTRKPFISSAFWNFGSVYTGWRLCDVSTVFTPQPGKDYEMIYEMQANTCNVRVMELSQYQGKIVKTPEQSTRRAKYRCVFEQVNQRHSEATSPVK